MITESSAHPSSPQGLGSQEDEPSSLLWQAQGGICPEVPEALTTSAGLQGDRSMGFGVVFGWRAGERQLCSPGSPACCSQSCCCCCPGLAQLFGTHQKLPH